MEDTVEVSTEVPHKTCKRATQGWKKEVMLKAMNTLNITVLKED